MSLDGLAKLSIAGLLFALLILAVPARAEVPVQAFKQPEPRYQGRTIHQWARLARVKDRQLRQERKNSAKRGRTIKELRREVLRRWDYPRLIQIAAKVYGVSGSMLERKARCESGNFTDFYNEKSQASNVMQFLPSTWATTPFGRFYIFDPFAAVLAGAWMHSVGRGGEWECR